MIMPLALLKCKRCSYKSQSSAALVLLYCTLRGGKPFADKMWLEDILCAQDGAGLCSTVYFTAVRM